jgi:hypothetical protein
MFAGGILFFVRVRTKNNQSRLSALIRGQLSGQCQRDAAQAKLYQAAGAAADKSIQ